VVIQGEAWNKSADASMESHYPLSVGRDYVVRLPIEGLAVFQELSFDLW